MLPDVSGLRLGQLSLHDVDDTMGFYAPSDAEWATVNDDPFTLEKPVATNLSFRVRLLDDGPNGEPRYKFFSPWHLWEWVKEHQELPTREGPIYYTDWWALCDVYNPDHHDIPFWAHTLKLRSEYVAERAARAQAAQEQQAARERERAAQEQRAARERERAARAQERRERPARRLPRLGRPGQVRLGPQRATDHLVEWEFWVKSDADPRYLPESIRQNFKTYMDDPTISYGNETPITDWHLRLKVTVTPADRMKRVRCQLYLPATRAEGFTSWMNFRLEHAGVSEFFWQMLGVREAKQLGTYLDASTVWPGPWVGAATRVRNRGAYWDLPPDEAVGDTRPDMPTAEFDAWQPLRVRTWTCGRAREADENEFARLRPIDAAGEVLGWAEVV